MRVWIGAGEGVDVQGAVDEADPLADEDVGGVRGLGRLVEPAGGGLLVVEGGEGPDRGGPGKRQGGRGALGPRLPWPPASAGRWRRCSQGCDDEDALAGAGTLTSQVAPIRERQRAGEVELRESE